MYKHRFNIAGIHFAIHCPLTLDDLGLTHRFGTFSNENTCFGPELTVTWREDAPEAVPYGDLRFDPGSIWQVHGRVHGEPGWTVRLHYPSFKSGLQAALTANADWSQVEMVERLQPGLSLLNYGAGELLLRARVLFADGLVFHASGIDDNGRGLMFVGHAGAGKSTQALMWSAEAGVIAMNDDRVAARLLPEGAVIYGTPWGGTAEIARNHNAPLRAIIILEQASENELLALPAKKAAPLLLPRAFLPYWDTGLMELATHNLQLLLEASPVYLLRCRPEPAVIDLVRKALR